MVGRFKSAFYLYLLLDVWVKEWAHNTKLEKKISKLIYFVGMLLYI